jgi:hypothetical protein
MNHNNENWLEVNDFNLNEFDGEELIDNYWRQHCWKLVFQMSNDEQLIRRWWPSQFVAFIQRTLRNNGYSKHPRHEFDTEDYLPHRYEWMADEWLIHKIQLNAKMPLITTLRKRWWAGKRHHFAMRNLRLR